ncbi:hypothetical protein [Neomoorella glycerini]|nr:hypothetical protein [Moorella glycerini]
MGAQVCQVKVARRLAAGHKAGFRPGNKLVVRLGAARPALV